MTVEQSRRLTVAEDIEYFSQWWKPESVDTTAIRHGSGILRRLLVEDAAGACWRALGFKKEPTIQGPDLLGFFQKEKFDVALTVGAISAGVRHEGIDTAFLSARRVDNPATGVLASADVGFAVSIGSAVRDARNPAPSADLDPFIERTWYLHQYLDAPGMIRRGMVLNRREVIKHVANEMGGVHVSKSSSQQRDLQIEAEDKLFVKGLIREIRGQYIEILAIGQAAARSADLQRLAHEIRTRS
jgi:hypothetical protein